MSILVFGRTGQVATELQRLAKVTALGRQEADLRDPEACAAAISARRPSAVINAAAFTAVDRAETEEAQATVINGDAPAAMALACALLDIPFIQVSTDYVFAGDGTDPWRPGDRTDPVNAYGRSKLAGEIGTRAAGGRHAILRTSWVFSPHGTNFLKTMMRQSATRDRLSVVADQVGGPTPARAVARACLTMAEALRTRPDCTGTYHLSGDADVSWYDFALEIFEQARRAVTVAAITTAAYPTPAARPLNSRLDCRSTLDTFGIARPDWRRAIALTLSELERHP